MTSISAASTLLAKARNKQEATVTFRNPGYGQKTVKAVVIDVSIAVDRKLSFLLATRGGHLSVHEDYLITAL